MIGYIIFSYDRTSTTRRVIAYDPETATNTIIDDFSLRKAVAKEINSRKGIKIIAIYEEAISSDTKSIIVWYEKSGG